MMEGTDHPRVGHRFGAQMAHGEPNQAHGPFGGPSVGGPNARKTIKEAATIYRPVQNGPIWPCQEKSPASPSAMDQPSCWWSERCCAWGQSHRRSLATAGLRGSRALVWSHLASAPFFPAWKEILYSWECEARCDLLSLLGARSKPKRSRLRPPRRSPPVPWRERDQRGRSRLAAHARRDDHLSRVPRRRRRLGGRCRRWR